MPAPNQSLLRIKAIITIAVFLCVVNLAYSQQAVLFDETFDNNNNNWQLRSDSNFLVKIDGGVLHLQKYQKNKENKGCIWLSKEIPRFNTSIDFAITFYAKFLSAGDLFSLVDFQWGFRNFAGTGINGRDSMYQADFIMEGRLHVNYFDKKWTYLHRVSLPDTSKKVTSATPITRTAAFAFPYKKNEFNKYEIIQQGDSITIKVNDYQILHQPIRRIYGNSIGIQQCLQSAWVMDRLVVKQDSYY